MQVADGRTVFSHEAMLYEGRDDFIRQTLPFIRDAVITKLPILVAVDRWKIDELRRSLGADATTVRFEDMARIGRNPARIIPVWRAFVDEHSAGNERGMRGIGEPIWAGRSADELVECERHEALLNVAFASPPAALRLICPYDTGSLPASVIEEARRNHPIVTNEGASARSETYKELDAIARPFDALLPPPAEIPDEMVFDEYRLHELRMFVKAQAMERGVEPARVPDVILAVDETATNSIRYGGAGGILRIWSQDGKMICEVHDHGLIDQPLVGRVTPDPKEPGRFGLWLANQLCDLVQVRTSTDGSTVRLHIDVA
ncbi:MAG: anti-sigma factor RsbA family regulatory protein [Actinomycetota bacterium]